MVLNIGINSKGKFSRYIIPRNFNFLTIKRDCSCSTTVSKRKDFRDKQEFFPKLKGLRSIRTTIDNKAPRPLQYPHYERFESAVPFYQKRKFWLWACGLGGLSGIYYTSHLETVPISNRRRFIDVTPKEEEHMAQQAFQQVMSRYRHKILHPADARSQYVRQVADRIIRVSGMQGFFFIVLKKNDTGNMLNNYEFKFQRRSQMGILRDRVS